MIQRQSKDCFTEIYLHWKMQVWKILLTVFQPVGWLYHILTGLIKHFQSSSVLIAKWTYWLAFKPVLIYFHIYFLPTFRFKHKNPEVDKSVPSFYWWRILIFLKAIGKRWGSFLELLIGNYKYINLIHKTVKCLGRVSGTGNHARKRKHLCSFSRTREENGY